MKAYLIDPAAQNVREVEYSMDYRQIYQLIESPLVDIVWLNDHGDCAYVDDAHPRHRGPKMFFHIEGLPHPLCGKGLVLGTDVDGYKKPPVEPIETFINGLKFYTSEQVMDMFDRSTEKEKV